MSNLDTAITGEQGSSQASTASTSSTPIKPDKPRGLRKWVYRLLAMTLVPALLFVILEGSLRLAGYGQATTFFLDGSNIEGSEVWIENGDFDRRFFPLELHGSSRANPFAFAKKKPSGTFRVFVLGESAAMGFPDPSTSFSRLLEVMLHERYPNKRIEVVNTAMTAINSHVVLPIARECAEHEPDLFIVHLGNNEVVGPYGAAGVLGPFSPSLGIIRANLAVKTTRTGQLLNRAIQGLTQSSRPKQRVWDGMATFAGTSLRPGDSRGERIYAHFRENLHDICAAGTELGIPVVVCSIPVNLKDSAPFGSRHGPDLNDAQTASWEKAYQDGVRLQSEKKYAEAIRCFETARAVDGTFADLLFRLGRCYLALGQNAKARESFARAVDFDALRFRADATINKIIREEASANAENGVHLADAERAFAQSSPGGMPGEDYFHEHVHMNFSGNYLLAKTVFETITQLAPTGLASASEFGPASETRTKPLSEQRCAELLARTEWSDLRSATHIFFMLAVTEPFTSQLDHRERAQRWKTKIQAMQARFHSGGVQKAVAVYQKALSLAKPDLMIRMNFADMLNELGDLNAAEEQYLTALHFLRHDFAGHCKLGNLLLKMNRVTNAVAQFQESIRLAPDYLNAYFGLAQAAAMKGKNDEAIAYFEAPIKEGTNRLLGLIQLAHFLALIGKHQEAEQRFREALEISPKNVTAMVGLGDAALMQERVEEAIGHFESALRVWPDWPEVKDKLADAKNKLAKSAKKPTESAPGK